MKICYLDAFSGISGDMLVGALADAGADRQRLTEGIEALGTGAALRFEKTKRRGIEATKFHVDYEDPKSHRHLSHILKMIAEAPLPERTRANATAVFEAIGRAEAEVHAMPIEKVHFHEVGAIDSIVDIVGACLGFELLGVEEIQCSPVNVGSGTVATAHGVLPVPAPATATLLEGCPIYSRGPAVELATPTGAGIAATLAKRFGTLPPMRITATGYGAGDKDFAEHANVLRVLIGELTGVPEAAAVSVIEANLDDASPEWLGFAMERLLERGALDVSYAPIFMKKNRPGTLLRVIARPEDREALAATVFAETSTLGLRIYETERRVQERRTVEVQTPHGSVRVKVAGDGGFAPEYEDCRRLALATGLPLRRIFEQAAAAYLEHRQ
jgi:pyridinium-3,5-bisthiocarboxylic acid mononucleotide nickel chelatase